MRSKVFNKKILIYILAFFIPIFIMVGYTFYIDIITNGNYFNNGENFLVADMASQYNSLYNYIHDVLVGNDSIFYSFTKGMGGNMASTVGYYLASPFNILYMFSSKINTPFMTYIILLIKFGLCSLFMNMFLNYKYKARFTHLIFSLSYALMGFTTVYYFNNMWLDVIYMTPLVMIGINKLINGNSTFYIITLSLSIIFNFYIAYMLCIFCVIYFIYELFIKYKFKEFKIYKRIIINFILSSILAAGISCIILLPSLINLSHIIRSSIDRSLMSINTNQLVKNFFNEIFSKTFIGAHNETSILGRNRPVIYVCLFCLLLVFLYFFNKKIKRKEKILSLFIILFFIASMIIPHLKLFWQAFSFPNGYISRFTFLYSFFLIYISSRCFYNLDKIKLRYFIIITVLYILAANYTSKMYLVFLDNLDILISIIFIMIYAIIYFLYTRLKKTMIRILLTILLILFVIFELTFNYIDTLVTVGSMKAISGYNIHFNETCHNLTNIEDNFYRIDGNYYYSYLDSHTCGFNGITTALSTNDGDLYKFFYNNGGSLTYTTIIYDFNKLPILDALFGVKYINSQEKLEDTIYQEFNKFKISKFNSFKKKYEKKYIYLYKNPYALSLGYMIDDNYHQFDKMKKNNSFDYLNSLIKSLSGIDEDILIPLEKEYLGNNVYKFNIDTDSEYIYLSVDYDISINWTVYDNVYINDNYIVSLDSENIGIVKLKNEYKNSEINVKLESVNTKVQDKAYLYYLDMDAFKHAINNLKKNQMTNVKIKGNKVHGNISADKDGTMFLSIPYEKGWNVYVDDKKVNYQKVADEFIGINITKGKHKITMVYYSNGFFKGLIISLISIGILIIYIVKIRKIKIIRHK